MSPEDDNPGHAGAVIRWIRERAGLALVPDQLDDAEARVRRTMARAGFDEAGRYLDFLCGNAPAFEDLAAELTVGETYFFRDPAQLDFVRREALPDIRRRTGDGHPLRVWSAGCASGEEAYSLAILLDEAGDDAPVFASDLSRASLAKARAAVYGPWSLRGVDAAVVRRHFRPRDGRHVLDERIRRRVSFMPLNLAADGYPSLAGPWGMDLILCRNVLMYFHPEAVKHTARRSSRGLRTRRSPRTRPSRRS
jgi:chemotaxis protein methyltransferase CheR